MSLPHRIIPTVPRVEARPSWISNRTPRQLQMLAGTLGMGVCVCNMLLDVTTLRGRAPRWKLRALADVTGGVIAGFVAAKLLGDLRERRRSVIQRLEMVSAMNHHIRNALETIELSVYTTDNQQAINTIHEAVERIEWALREVLPQ